MSSLIFITATGIVMNGGDRYLLPVFPYIVLFFLEIFMVVIELVQRMLQNRLINSQT